VTLTLKYEKQGYSFYANNKLITDYSRMGFDKAKKQIQEAAVILEMVGITPRVVIDTDNLLQRREYNFRPKAGRVTTQ
jgi:hypothetical protein